MTFNQIKIGQKFRFKRDYGTENCVARDFIYEKIEPTPPRDQVNFDFQAKNAKVIIGPIDGNVFFVDEEKVPKSEDKFEIIE